MSDPFPDAATRRDRLRAIVAMLLNHSADIRAALAADFGAHPNPFTDLVEVLGVADRATFAGRQLASWMAEERRPTDETLYGATRAGIRYQPKGVVGSIVPWNLPFDLSLGPLVEMLAAGNRVIIKPSESAPACAELLRRMVVSTFPEDLVAVSVGGLALAREFPTLPWDHLLFTGSHAIGREVARAAAENLVPVTLELGGKCPAVMTADGVNAANVRTVVGAKLIKNGQMCTAVDYVLVPRHKLESFLAFTAQYFSDDMPRYATSDSCTGIITKRHLDRIAAMLDEARAAGVRLISLGGDGDPATRRLPLVLAVDPPRSLRVMREEIFGPILPVVPYDDLDEAIDEVNAGERPLGLYAFSKEPSVANYILRRSTSGGACINTCMVQSALPSLGFGGVGQSGSGRHHGIDGFHEFSNPRGVVVHGAGDMTDAFFPPYGQLAKEIVDAITIDAVADDGGNR